MNSATGTALAPAVMATGMRRARAAARSILSTPMPHFWIEPEPGRGIHEARGNGRDAAHEEGGVARQREPVGGIGGRGQAELQRRRAFGRDDGAHLGRVDVEEDHDRPRHG